MRMKAKIGTASVVLGSLVLGSAYADTVDNPGAVTFTANVDSKLQAVGGGVPIDVNRAGTMLLVGSLDSAGASFFDQADIFFEQYTDGSGFTHQVQPLSDGTGTYCPNSGAATIALSARVKITKVNNVSIATTPCYITINSGSAFTLTTETSGSLTGVRFSQATPKFVAQVTFDPTIAGTCSAQNKLDIKNHYGVGASATTAAFELYGAAIDPTNFSGNGC